MARARTFTGKSVPIDEPGCEPLHSFVGLELCAQFMRMFDVHLSNGHTARAFKNSITRCYLHLDRTEPGLAYVYTGARRYRAVDLSSALIAVFCLWDDRLLLRDVDRDRALLGLALDRLDATAPELDATRENPHA